MLSALSKSASSYIFNSIIDDWQATQHASPLARLPPPA